VSTLKIEFKTVQKELPIFSTNISQHKDILRLAVEAIHELHQQNPKSIESNVVANYVSSWTSHLESPKLQPLCDLVLSFCKEISKTYYKSDIDFKIFNCWGAVYEGGDYTKKHSHYPSTFAAVVYIDLDKGSAPIIFEDQLTVVPASGSLILFPAILEHEVPKTDSRRVVIAMNIDYASG
jgi:hypothetical protein